MHDSLPQQGISGMIVFLRHFTLLKNWEIHILIPENAYREEIVKNYPPNFYVHTFPLRLFWWPTFREDIPIMVKIRVWVLSRLFQKYIDQIKPDQLISVQYHYYSVAIAQNAKKTKIPLICFLHDRWDLTSNNPYIQGVRMSYAQQTLKNSSVILSVTQELIQHYLGKSPNKGQVFYPIPEGYISKKTLTLSLKNLIYAGTVEEHHIVFFEKIMPHLKAINWKLTVICNDPEKLKILALNNPHLETLHSFETNKEALRYLDDNASALLVNYGLTNSANPFAFHSFPSKFVEYSHLGKPIITVAPKGSPFERFLTKNNWDLLISDDQKLILTLLNNLNQPTEWSKYAQQTEKIKNQYFNPEIIQDEFHSILTRLYENH